MLVVLGCVLGLHLHTRPNTRVYIKQNTTRPTTRVYIKQNTHGNVSTHEANTHGNVSAQVLSGGGSAGATNPVQLFSAGLAQPSEAEMCEIASQYTPQPSLCTLGHDRISTNALVASIPAFSQTLALMRSTFAGVQCCMGINHLFAVYSAVQEVQPLAVLESGVAAGHTTWLLRHLLPSAPIFSLDPGDPVLSYQPAGGIVGYRDPSPLTTYLVGTTFLDLAQARWDLLIPDPAVRARTFVLLDDHQSTTERVRMLRRWGFRYIFYEDNYPFGVATSADQVTCPQLPPTRPRTYASRMHGDSYSPNTMCAPVPAGTVDVLYKDRFGKVCKVISLQEHQANVAYFQSVLASYYEFPALFSTCASARSPLLSEAQLVAFGLPLPWQEIWHYGHLHPPLMELKPNAPAAVAGELAAAIVAATTFATDVAAGRQVV